MKKELPKLESKHIVWIVDAAAEAFEKRVEETELEIVRHTVFKDLPISTARISRSTSRMEKIEQLKDYLRQYTDILAVLKVAREKAVDYSAEEFARTFKGAFKL